MTLRLTEDEQRALKERAAADGVSMQDAARAAIREYVDRGRRMARVDKAADKILKAHADALRRLGE
jgi:plasmid stability protein